MLTKSNSPGLIKEVGFSFITSIAYLLVGINRSFTAFLFHQLEQPDSIIVIDDSQKSWIASFTILLSPIGCIISGVIMDVLGRKFFMHIVFLPYALSWLITSFASNIETLYVGIVIQGIGAGMSFCISPYISEISTTDHRGALLALIEITYSIGIVITNALMYKLSWHVVAMIFTILSMGAFLFTFVLPESPMWLYSKGKRDESIEVLKSLRSGDQIALEQEIEDMESACESQAKTDLVGTLKECIHAWRQFVLVISLFIFMQNTGFAMMVSFTVTIVDHLRIPYESGIVTLLYSGCSFIASFVTPYALHNFGRKTILTASALCMGISMTCVAIYEEIFYESSSKPFAWIVPVALCTYVFTCTLGVLPISFLVGGEIFSHEVRGVMNGLYGACGYIYWATAFKIFPLYLSHFGIKIVIWTFVGFSGVVVFYAVFLLPETQGISLNEVQRKYFQKRKKSVQA